MGRNQTIPKPISLVGALDDSMPRSAAVLLAALLAGCVDPPATSPGTSSTPAPFPDAHVSVATTYDERFTRAEDRDEDLAPGAPAVRGQAIVYLVPTPAYEDWRELRDSGLWDPVYPDRAEPGARLVDNDAGYWLPLDDQGRVEFSVGRSEPLFVSAWVGGAVPDSSPACHGAWYVQGTPQDRDAEGTFALTLPFGIQCPEPG